MWTFEDVENSEVVEGKTAEAEHRCYKLTDGGNKDSGG